MSSRLAEACNLQASSCAALGSDFMTQLMHLLAANANTHPALKNWAAKFQGDIGPFGASLPLRIAGGLHNLVLSRSDLALAEVYPPASVSNDVLWSAVDHALVIHPNFWSAWLRHAPQTNEVRRSAALIASAHFIAGQCTRPLSVSELGASAGLNLMFDQFQLVANGQTLGPTSKVNLAPSWTGSVPEPKLFSIGERRGIDLNPLDTTDPKARLRLLSYLWADQPERATLTKAAIDLQTAIVDQGDAIDWLEERLQDQKSNPHLIYHTIAWQYFPEKAQARGLKLIEQAGLSATKKSPLFWLSMEAEDGAKGAVLKLRVWPGDVKIHLGHVDFHGRWIDWQAPSRLDLPW